MIHNDHLTHTIEPYYGNGMRVIFLGDQVMNLATCQSHEGVPAIKYFEENMDTVSIDITGENGALNIDLSKNQAKKNLPDPADIVADYGTTEHVKSLIPCLKNTFNMLKVGGLAIHVNPLKGHFPNHNAYHYFSEEFWSKYIKLIGLEFVRVFTHPAYHNVDTGMEVYALYRRTEKSKFPTGGNSKKYKELQELIKTHITKE